MSTVAEPTAYNDTAIDIAERLTAARREAFAAREKKTSSNPLTAEQLLAYNPAAKGVYLEWQAMGERPVTEALDARAAALGATFEHLGTTIGTVIHGVDLTPPHDAEVIAFIRATLLERKVIFFRDQHLSEDDQVSFGRCFGGLDAFPFGPPGENPYILEIRHGRVSPGSENGWHTDVTWMEQPSLGSIAQLIASPEHGGATLFADSHAAWHGLPDNVKERLLHIDGVNDYRGFIGERARGRGGLPADLVAEVKERIPFGVTHPLARKHPETGKISLYLHGGFLRHDSLHDRRTGEPLDEDDAKQLLELLLHQHTRPEYQCRFTWQVGSIAFWDNRAVQHYAASDYYPNTRVLRRVTVSGDRPVAPAA